MSGGFELFKPLAGAQFGGRLQFDGGGGAQQFVEAAERDPLRRYPEHLRKRPMDCCCCKGWRR